MFRFSSRELGGVSLWYCEGICCVLVHRRGVWGYAPQRKFLYKVVSMGILDHFSRFANPSLQLHMHAMPWGTTGSNSRG